MVALLQNNPEAASTSYLCTVQRKITNHQQASDCGRGAGRREKGEQDDVEKDSKSEKEKCLLIHTRRQRQGVHTPQQTHRHREAGNRQWSRTRRDANGEALLKPSKEVSIRFPDWAKPGTCQCGNRLKGRKIALCGSEERVQSGFSTEAHRFCVRERHGDN